jgi:hypothetical protein
MKVVDPGQVYELSTGDDIVFLRKEDGRTVREGTTIEELVEVLIHRVTEAYQRLPCQESIRALYLLHEALAAFQTRSARRVAAKVEGTLNPHDPVVESPDVLRGKPVSRDLDGLDHAPN